MQPLRRETMSHDYRAELFELIRTRSFGRGKIMLASGRESDYYIDMRPTTVHPAGATCVGELIVDALEGLSVDFVGGLEMGAVPIAQAARKQPRPSLSISEPRRFKSQMKSISPAAFRRRHPGQAMQSIASRDPFAYAFRNSSAV